MISVRRKDVQVVQTERQSDHSKIQTPSETIISPTPETIAQDIGLLTGKEIMDKAIEDVSLDRFLDGNPKVINKPGDYIALVERLRKRRALDIQKEIKGKKGKKDVSDETTEGK